MEGSYLRAAATRCLAAARECFDWRAKQELRQIAEDFTRKADELDGFRGPVAAVTMAAGGNAESK